MLILVELTISFSSFLRLISDPLPQDIQKVIVNKSNKNDIIRIFGQPHATSQNEEDTWIYFERILTKGKYHKLGRHVVKENNVLVLEFDKFGIIKNKKLYTKDDINKIAFFVGSKM